MDFIIFAGVIIFSIVVSSMDKSGKGNTPIKLRKINDSIPKSKGAGSSTIETKWDKKYRSNLARTIKARTKKNRAGKSANPIASALEASLGFVIETIEDAEMGGHEDETVLDHVDEFGVRLEAPEIAAHTEVDVELQRFKSELRSHDMGKVSKRESPMHLKVARKTRKKRAKKKKNPAKTNDLRNHLRRPESLKNAMLLHEILGKPRALQEQNTLF